MRLFSNTLLLFLFLCIGAVSLALSLHYGYKKEYLLLSEGKEIEKKLHQKEVFIGQLLNRPSFIDSLKNIQQNPGWAQKLVPEFRNDRLIYLQTFYQNKCTFYNNIGVYFKTDQFLKKGSSFLSTPNGFYEAIKTTKGNFSVVFYIPIKNNYPYLNQYLKNNFSPDLIGKNHLELAGLSDKEVYGIRNVHGKYLFSVKLKSTPGNIYSASLELWIWLMAILFGLIAFNLWCLHLSRNKGFKTGFICLVSGIVIFRLVALKLGLLDHYFDLEIFDPKNYAASFLSPSLGDLLLNTLSISWILTFFYLHQDDFRLYHLKSKFWKPLLIILFVLILFGAAYQFHELIFSLIYNSNINLDLSNIINLNGFSWLGILIICLGVFNFFLLIDIVISLSKRLKLNHPKQDYTLCWGMVLLSLAYQFIAKDFNLFFTLLPFILAIQSWYRINRTRLPIEGVVIIVLVFALAVSVELSRFREIKEHESRKLLAQRLESPEDPNAVLLFLSKENRIAADWVVADYFKTPLINHQILVNRLEKLYLDGYLSRYECNVYEFLPNGKSVILETDLKLDHFKDQVLSGSIKVSKYFYRNTNNYGFQSYFAIIPVNENNLFLGTLVIELKTKPMDEINNFPQLLMDGKVELDLGLGEYSYGFYHLNQLIDQHGDYIYEIINKKYKGKISDFVFTSDNDYTGKRFDHLIYQPNSWKVIIVSKRTDSLIENLASVSFLFLLLLVFAAFIFLLNKINTYKNHWKKIFWPISLLYTTRIQLSLVSAVVFTLSLTGMITFYNISKQYHSQQEENILEKSKELGKGIENQFIKNDSLILDEQAEVAIQHFAEISRADINLYNRQGNLLLSSQPKFYETGLIAPKLNALAYVYLHQLQVSEYMGHEKIGGLSFLTGYVPIKNSHKQTIGYLGFPYFSNEQDFQSRIGSFLNALINLYAVVLVIIGFVAVFIANQITNPLSLIQKSLSQTKIGRKNQLIKWKRKDEIGSLIKEYNNMILALEESAQKLAQSERETAWREMAKQVAHEIKNPLTPLKLGVQLLKKSWEEKDPDFDQKFEKFSKSFIEQIESLSHIASEFSNFAKMPETVLEIVELEPLLEQSIEVYRQMQEIKISLNNSFKGKIWIKADKDQLLRSFNNLIKNAIEAMPNGKIGHIQIRLHKDEQWAYVEITDNGSGISEKLKDRIFVPNFTTKTSGMGLGLAFVKQSLSSIGGSIYFETEDGKGTTFFIRIPLIISA